MFHNFIYVLNQGCVSFLLCFNFGLLYVVAIGFGFLAQNNFDLKKLVKKTFKKKIGSEFFMASVRSRPPGPPAVPGVFSTKSEPSREFLTERS